MRATFAAASDAANVRPEVILPEDSGPIAPVDKSTPATWKVLGVMKPRLVVPLPLPVPNPPAGIVPEMATSLRLSEPVAAATRARCAIEVTDPAPIGPCRPLDSRLLLNLLPGAGRLRVPPLKPNPKPPGPPAPAAGAC